MSIFAAECTKVVSIPFDPPHTATFRKLSSVEFQGLRDIITSEVVTWRHKALLKAMTAWSYPKPIDFETLLGLTEEALDFLATEAMVLTNPDLHKTKVEVEAEQKNDAGATTSV